MMLPLKGVNLSFVPRLRRRFLNPKSLFFLFIIFLRKSFLSKASDIGSVVGGGDPVAGKSDTAVWVAWAARFRASMLMKKALRSLGSGVITATGVVVGGSSAKVLRSLLVLFFNFLFFFDWFHVRSFPTLEV